MCYCMKEKLVCFGVRTNGGGTCLAEGDKNRKRSALVESEKNISIDLPPYNRETLLR